jgi:hypothetical protein
MLFTCQAPAVPLAQIRSRQQHLLSSLGSKKYNLQKDSDMRQLSDFLSSYHPLHSLDDCTPQQIADYIIFRTQLPNVGKGRTVVHSTDCPHIMSSMQLPSLWQTLLSRTVGQTPPSPVWRTQVQAAVGAAESVRQPSQKQVDFKSATCNR